MHPWQCCYASAILLRLCPSPHGHPHAGPTTAAGMAAAKGWRSSLVPALLIGIMGYATATFVGVACAGLFRRMQLPC